MRQTVCLDTHGLVGSYALKSVAFHNENEAMECHVYHVRMTLFHVACSQGMVLMLPNVAL